MVPSTLAPTALFVFAILLSPYAAYAGDGETDAAVAATLAAASAEDQLSLTLDTGEVLSVSVVTVGDDALVADHSILGRLAVPLERVDAITNLTSPAPAVVEAAVQDADEGAPDDETGWGGEVSLGLDGSSGNSDRSSFRVGAKAAREMKRNRAEASVYWTRSEEESDTTEHKARADGRYDWLFEESLWETFAKGDVEYDEFKDFDLRVTGFGGAGYRLIDEEGERLIARAGAGASKKIGGMDTDIDPELLLGADYQRQLSESQAVNASLELFPNLGNFGEYRAVAKADWEVTLAEDAAVSLRLGVEDRYDSDAVPGDDKNDLDYYGTLVKKF